MTLKKNLTAFRSVDTQIIRLIGKRMRLAKETGRLKKILGIPIRNAARERQAILRARTQARKQGFDPVIAEKITKILITASRDIQRHV